jgi:hypothetical protein
MPSRSYNSVIFASVGANNYMVFSVNQTIIESHDFLDSLSWDEAPILKSTLAGRLDRLENEQCIRSYATMFLSSRSNLLLVTSSYVDIIRTSFVYKYHTSTDVDIVTKLFRFIAFLVWA